MTLPPAKTSKPPAPTWETVKKPAKATSRNMTNQQPRQGGPVGSAGWNRQPPARQQPPPPQLARPMTQSVPQPKPGSWAARALPPQQQGQDTSSSLRAGANTFQPGRTHVSQSPQGRPAPASDWRSHSMPISPRHGRKQLLPPQAPPQSDDFPTLGGMKKSPSAAAGTPGAWGTKR